MEHGSTTDLVPRREALLAALRSGHLRKRDGRFRLMVLREFLLDEHRAGRLTREQFFSRVEQACQYFYQREYDRAKRRRRP